MFTFDWVLNFEITIIVFIGIEVCYTIITCNKYLTPTILLYIYIYEIVHKVFFVIFKAYDSWILRVMKCSLDIINLKLCV